MSRTVSAGAAVRGQVLLLGAQARGVVRQVRVRRAARGLRARRRRARAERRRAAAVRLAACIALHVELRTTARLLVSLLTTQSSEPAYVNCESRSLSR